MESINWKEEAKQLKTAKDFEDQKEWFLATEGNHKIKITKVGDFYETEIQGDKLTKLRLEIETRGKEYNWGITKGITKVSLFGQLSLLGAHWGTLEGKDITLIVMGEGNKKRYTIVEASNLANDEVAENGA